MDDRLTCSRCGVAKAPNSFYRRGSGLRGTCKACDESRARLKLQRTEGRSPEAGRTEKKCSKCQRVKLLDHFWRDRKSLDGHSYICVECRKVMYAEGTGAPEDTPCRKAIFRERYLCLYRVKKLMCGRPIPHGMLNLLLPL